MSLVEVLVAATLMTIALVPAINALNAGLSAASINVTISQEHYEAVSAMEQILAEPFSTLVSAAAGAGNETTATTYSTTLTSGVALNVFIALYDAENADSDDDPFTVPDPNLDGDNNVYSNYDGVLWIRVAPAGSITQLDTLTTR